MLNYQEFKEEVVGKIGNYLPQECKDAQVILKPVQKINLEMDGLMLKCKESKYAPTVYLENLYKHYLDNGGNLENVLKQLVDTMCSEGVNEQEMQSLFENLEEKIFWQVINTEANKKLLSGIPHRTFEDLSIIYRVLVKSDSSGIGSFIVNNDAAGNFGLSEEKLYQLAKKNAKRLMKPTVRILSQVLAECGYLSQEETDEAFMAEDMYVISNSENINGAACLLDEMVFQELAKKTDSDLYILPSSIHELIAVSVGDKNPEVLAEMVRAINSSVVSPMEILSDSVYYYCRSTRSIKRIA
ncbi:MAG: hypothetical protein IJN92_09995 [Lachnospiraceae bacterium]|nr:hypothetical protein [Lachnospiraceae bacterium]